MKPLWDRWNDLPDYILGITEEIWEGRGIAKLHDYFAEDVIFRMPSGLGVGNKAVIAATMATLAEFPDRQLLGEDVIWSGTEDLGMLSSHRLFCTATHTGHGMFGAPTGKPVQFRAIAECHVKNGVIDDEWLTRDTGAVCRQLGRTAKDHARRLIDMQGGPSRAKRPFTPDQDRPGPYQGQGNDHVAGVRLAAILRSVMQTDLAVIRRDYDRACTLHQPGGVTGRSWTDAEEFWIGLRAAFPDATFRIDHQIGLADDLMGPRGAVRWSLHGQHDGWGSFGPPTGAQVYIMGFTHADFGPRGLRTECTVFDEVAIWQQIHFHTG
jgi:predicted ester cyclase